MKKLLLLLVTVVCLGTAANAQFTHKFSVQKIIPINPTVIAGQPYNITDSFVVTLDQGSLTPTDTIAFGSPITVGQNGPVVILRWGFTKNQGDTIRLRYQNGVSFGTPGSYNYCIRAFTFDRSSTTLRPTSFDTTGWSDCSTLTVTGFPASTNDYFVKNEDLSKQKLNVYPNPATGNSIGMDFIAQNASVVTAKVYDLAGRTILSHTFDRAYKGKKDFKLDISAINKGLYILELRQNGIKATGQFVK
jgi:hypothetical protein